MVHGVNVRDKIMGIEDTVVGVIPFDFDANDLTGPFLQLLLALDGIASAQGSLVGAKGDSRGMVHTDRAANVFGSLWFAPSSVRKSTRVAGFVLV